MPSKRRKMIARMDKRPAARIIVDDPSPGFAATFRAWTHQERVEWIADTKTFLAYIESRIARPGPSVVIVSKFAEGADVPPS